MPRRRTPERLDQLADADGCHGRHSTSPALAARQGRCAITAATLATLTHVREFSRARHMRRRPARQNPGSALAELGLALAPGSGDA